jgi:hypothetical protein
VARRRRAVATDHLALANLAIVAKPLCRLRIVTWIGACVPSSVLTGDGIELAMSKPVEAA